MVDTSKHWIYKAKDNSGFISYSKISGETEFYLSFEQLENKIALSANEKLALS